MKTERINVTIYWSNKLPGILAAFVTAMLTFSVLPKAWSDDLFWTGTGVIPPAVAGSGPWVTPEPYGVISWSSTSGTTNTPVLWTDGSVAHFQGSAGGTATLASNITAAGINFDPGANTFTIDTNGNVLTIDGAGIVNSSGRTQTIINNGGTSGFESTTPAGSTVFSGSSTAGSATITNNGGTGEHSTGGYTQFLDAATAGSATIITNGGTGGGAGGTTYFFDSSDGGTARAITNGNGSFDISGLTTAGMGIGSIEGSGNYFLGSKTLIVGGNNLSTTVSGVIQDGGIDGGVGGSLTKIGTGTLTLSGANTYTGATTVNAGSLIVDGSIASAQTLVNAGGFLGGHGTIGGNLVNNGIVGQVNSPGTLTVSGNYTQNAGGTLRIGVGGLAPSQHDVLAVKGHASLAGTLQLIQLGSFSLQPGNQITFLTANNGVSGTFSTVQNGIPSTSTGTIVQVQVTFLPNSVVLEETQGSFTQIPGVTLTPNQFAVGNMLNSAVGNPAAAPLFAFLNSQPVANLPHDYNLIAPTQVSSFHATGAAHGNTQIANLGGRMANIRAGLTGFSSIGFTLNGSVASSGEGFAGVSGPEGKSGPSVLAPTPDNRWGVFVTGIGEFTNVDSTPNAAGYDIDTGGVTFGVDYRVCPFFAIGLSAGYAHTKVNIDSAGGHIDVSSGKFGLYATAFTQGFYVDAAVSGGPSGYKSDRSALQGTASGSTDSGDLNALVATGYDWKFGGLTIGPTASFQYGYIGLNAFTETGSLAPLKFPDQTSESERTAFGVKTSYDWKVGHVDVLPEFRAAWQHEYGDTEYSIISNLASGAGNSFTVTGPPIGRDSLLIGVGAAVVWNDRVTTYIYYDGEFARTNYLSNNVSAGVRVTF